MSKNEFLDAIQKEGLITPTDDKQTETATAPSAETKETETPPSPQGGQPEEKPKDNSVAEEVPFHKHPRFKALIEENRAFKQQLEELLPLKEQVQRIQGSAQPSAQIPEWFQELYGDNQDIWQKYQSHDVAQRQALKTELLQEIQQQSKKAVEEEQKWSKWVDSQIDTLRDEGKKFDENGLKKVMAEYRPTDEKGYLDFHKGYELYEKITPAPDTSKSQARKNVAAQTTDNAKPAENKQKDILTAADLRRKGWY